MRLGRLVLAASCLLALSRPLQAQASSSLRRSEARGATVGEMVERLTRSRTVRTKVIGLDAADSAFVFPSAGSVQGAGGTFFRSDVMIVNHRSVDQNIQIGWIAQGVDNSNRPIQPFVLEANRPYILADFVGNTLGESGLGAVLVTGVTSNGSSDGSATIDGFSRIYTNQPGASGTVSLSFPSISILDSFGNSLAYALGMRHDPGYRCNVGIVNLDAVPHTWTVTINGLRASTSFTVTVDGVSMRQVAIPAGDYGDLLVSLVPNAGNFWWSAYSASVDNITGDGWVSHASQP
jgi:hypothetical protein